MLKKVHRIFIDKFLQTYSIEQSAKAAGIPQSEALTAGIEFLKNPEVIAALETRKNDIIQAYSNVTLDKQSLLRLLMLQYENANKLEKTKEAADILCKIAETQGYDFKTMNVEPVTFVINNLDENKI